MNVRLETEITPEIAKQLRLDSNLTQREFWSAVGSNQASGHWFEVGKRKRIPKPIRMLIFLRYIAKFEINLDDPITAGALVRIGNEISAKLDAERAEAEAREATRRAKEAQRRVRQIAA